MKYLNTRILLAILSIGLLTAENPILFDFMGKPISRDLMTHEEVSNFSIKAFNLDKNAVFNVGLPYTIGACSVTVTNEEKTKVTVITMEGGSETQTVELTKYDLKDTDKDPNSDFNDVNDKYIQPFLTKCKNIHIIEKIKNNLVNILQPEKAAKLQNEDSFFIEETEVNPAILISVIGNTSNKPNKYDVLELQFRSSYSSTTLIIVPSEETVYTKQIIDNLKTFKKLNQLMMEYMGHNDPGQVEYNATKEDLLDEFKNYEDLTTLQGIVFKSKCEEKDSFLIFEASYGKDDSAPQETDSGYQKLALPNPSMYNIRAIPKAFKLLLIQEASNDLVQESLSAVKKKKI